MLRETYLANLKNLPPNTVRVRVARPSLLSPSIELLKDWKDGRIKWTEYIVRFRKEILNNVKAVDKLREIRELAQYKEVYLFCYEKNPPCHRFILVNLINEL